MRAAVEQPAPRAGLRWEEACRSSCCVKLRYEHVGVGDATALPFLAHTLQQTRHRRRGAELTFAGYQGSGGIRTSAVKSAEDIHNAFDADDRNRLRGLLLRMVHLVDDDGRAVRRPPGGLDGAGDLLARLADAAS
ncbi:hypothetical protein [Streptomyces sp. NPDC088760]|uniref:nSTAND1 domain-containing NTPase n=1 Tax=Streptomyces sp. NPDC088760 TaxID=3365890 RepID=UPI00381FF6C7